MTSPKPLASPARLAELALENGWSPDEVLRMFRTMLDSSSTVASPRADRASPQATEGSAILQREFSRVASAKR